MNKPIWREPGLDEEIYGFQVICCNPECEWEGNIQQTVYQPHSRSEKLCPKCHEIVEPVSKREMFKRNEGRPE